jgi:hypothetical protein
MRILAMRRHQLNIYEVVRICLSVYLPLGLAICPENGEKSLALERIRTLRTQQRAKINNNQA